MQRDELEEKARELIAPEPPVDEAAAKRMLDDGVLVVTATRVVFVYRSFDVVKHELWPRGAFGSAACEARFGECQLVLGEGGWREHRFTVDEAAGRRLASLLAPPAASPPPTAGVSYAAPPKAASSPPPSPTGPTAAATARGDDAARPSVAAEEPRSAPAAAPGFPTRGRAAWGAGGAAPPPPLPDTPSAVPAPPRTSANPDLISQLKSLDGELRGAFGLPTQVGCFSGPVLAGLAAAAALALGWPVVPVVVAAFIVGWIWFVASIDAGDRWYYRHRMRERIEGLLLTHRLSLADLVRVAQAELAESSALRKNLEAEERGRDGVRRG